MGHYSIAGASSPTPCPSGSYQPEEGKIACLLAPKNSFTSDIGSSSIIRCGGSGYTHSEGSDKSSDCVYDADGDGIEDRYDTFPHISGQEIGIFQVVIIVTIIISSIIMAKNSGEEDE